MSRSNSIAKALRGVGGGAPPPITPTPEELAAIQAVTGGGMEDSGMGMPGGEAPNFYAPPAADPTQGPIPQANPYVLNQPLEQAAQPDRAPIHPIVAAIMKRMGLMNMVRNRGNQQVVDPLDMPQQ